MALTFPDVLSAAKELANRLKDHDTTAEALVSQAQSVYNQVEAMKQVNLRNALRSTLYLPIVFTFYFKLRTY